MHTIRFFYYSWGNHFKVEKGRREENVNTIPGEIKMLKTLDHKIEGSWSNKYIDVQRLWEEQERCL